MPIRFVKNILQGCSDRILSSVGTRSLRWWRMLAISAFIQLCLLAVAWYSIRSHRISSPNLADTSTPVHVTTNVPTYPVNQNSEPKGTPPLTSSHTLNTAQKGAQPLKGTPPSNDQLTSNALQHNTAPSALSATSSVASTSTLHAFPVPLQTWSFQSVISSGNTSITLPITRLRSVSLGDNRYMISLSNATATPGEGNFGMHYSFIHNEAGPTPVEISGGAYLKTSAQPKGFSLGALGLKLSPDGQLWTWGKGSQLSVRSHAHFLDRVGLIVYIQGILSSKRLRVSSLPIQLHLPIATRYGVRSIPVQLILMTATQNNCAPCVHAHTHADLGEVQDWSVWYDGARDWRPVRMQFLMGRDASWQLTLSEP